MIDVVTKQHQSNANKIKEIISTYHESEDLINIGAYVKGSNARIDQAIQMIDSINNYLKQDVSDKSTFDESVAKLEELLVSKITNEELN